MTDTVMRFSPTMKKKKEVKIHPVVNNYATNMNGVDEKDRDSGLDCFTQVSLYLP